MKAKISKRMLSLLLTAVMLVGLFPQTAQAADPVSIDLSAVNGNGTGYTYAANVLTITDSGSYILTGTTTTKRVVVSASSDVTLNGVNITGPVSNSPFSVSAGSTVNLTLSGSNTLTAGSGGAGLYVPASAAVIISGSGTLTANGGTATDGTSNGAGIGSMGANQDAGSITIRGGTVNATGGLYAAGIGGGNNKNGTAAGSGSNITITGGIVNANGNNHSPAIGGGCRGNGGNITISGGTVTATAGSSSAGIGGGFTGGAGNILISGGMVTAIGSDQSPGIGRDARVLVSDSSNNGGTASSIVISGGTIIAKGATGYPGVGSSDSTDTTTLKITGGSVQSNAVPVSPTSDGSTQVYLTTVTVQGSSGVLANTEASCTVKGVTFTAKTDGSGKLYLWLPAGAVNLTVTVSGVNYMGAGTVLSTGTAAFTAGLNTAPCLRAGIRSTVSINRQVGTAYNLKLDGIFEDADGDSLTYTVSVNSGTAQPANANYSYTATQEETITLEFTASDGKEDSTGHYTVTLIATDALPKNTLPVRKLNIPETATASVGVNTSYRLNLTDIFEDFDDDPLTYKVSVNGGASQPASQNYTYIPTVVQTDILKFTANDGKADSSDTYTVTLTVNEGIKIDLSTVNADGDGYTYAANVLTITNRGSYILTGTTTTKRVVVSVSSDITLNGASITGPAGSSPFSISAGSAVNLMLSGTNTLTAGNGGAGLHVPSSATIIISGSGTLTAKGGAATNGTSNGAGIGGMGGYGDAGSITIQSGTVNATGGLYAAGIGGGNNSNGTQAGTGGNITITGGIVNANGNNHSPAIGGGCRGNGGNITISGGTVTATAGSSSAGIGGGFTGGAGNILISGGMVTAIGSDQSPGIGRDARVLVSDSSNNGGTASSIVISGGTIIAKGATGYPGVGSSDSTDTTTLKITGGSVQSNAAPIGPTSDGSTQVYLATVTVRGASGVLAGIEASCTVKGVTFTAKTDGSGKLYLWLPAGAVNLTVTVDGVNYIGTGTVLSANTATFTAGLNIAPCLRAGIRGTAGINCQVGTACTLNLDGIFVDTDGDPLTYTVSVNGETAQPADLNYTYTAMQEGTILLEFTANDGKEDSTGHYTVTLVATDALPENTPVRKSNVPETATASVGVNTSYSLNLADIFEDFDSDPLTYKVSVNGGASQPAGQNYTYTPTVVRTDILKFTASDGKADSSDTYTVALAVSAGIVINLTTVSTSGTGYTYTSGMINITNSGSYVLTGAATTKHVVVTAPTAYIVLRGLYIEAGGTAAPISVAAGSSVNLVLEGVNTLTGLSGCAGLHVPEGATVVIDGTGSLYASGGPVTGYNANGTAGAGIGGMGATGTAGNITIKGGTITAKGGPYTAGIGGGNNSNGTASGSGGNITINGGTVTATGGTHASAIGGGCRGNGGNIIINGGTVNAVGGTGSAAIGGGFTGGAGNILISAGFVTAIGKDIAPGIGRESSELITNSLVTGGTASSIVISGGTIIATGAAGYPGIGRSGETDPTTLKITGGSVVSDTVPVNPTSDGVTSVHLTTVTVKGLNDVLANTEVSCTTGTAVFPAKTDSLGKLYLWLKEGTVNLVITADSMEYSASGTVLSGGTTMLTAKVYATRNITVQNDGNGTTSGGGTYEDGQSVTLGAVPASGYNFDGWYAGAVKVSSLPNYTLTVTGDIALTAKFQAMPKDDLEVITIGGGSVRMNDETGTLNLNYMSQQTRGISIRLTAMPNTGYQFSYWQDTRSGSILSTNQVYEIVMGTGISLKAVFTRIPDADTTEFTVIFKDKSGKILQSTNVQKNQPVTPPSSPTLVGYTFTGWDKELDHVTSDMTVNAVYARLSDTYQVTVVNGTLLDGTASGDFQYDMPVTVVAGTAPAGQKFSHWEQDGVRISVSAVYSFFAPMRATTLTAVYVPEETAIVETPFITLSSAVEVDTAGKSMLFTANRTVPAGYTLIESGVLLLQSNTALADELTVDTAGVIRGKIKNDSTNQFHIRKNTISTGDTWYGRAYLIYKDEAGNIITVYSENTECRTMN